MLITNVKTINEVKYSCIKSIRLYIYLALKIAFSENNLLFNQLNKPFLMQASIYLSIAIYRPITTLL